MAPGPRSARTLLGSLILAFALACGGGGGGSTPAPAPAPPAPPPTPPPAPPVIATFSATPAAVQPGQGSLLAWTVTGAATLSVDQGVGAVTGSSVTVHPTTPTTYTLTATNAGGSATDSVTVDVGPAPVISAFTATPANLPAGQTCQLAWTASGADTLSLDQGVGSVTGASLGVTPASTLTYTLTASNAYGSSAASVTVTVGVAPLIASFTATPGSVAVGQASTLAWSVSGATSLGLDQGIGAVTGTSRGVSPGSTTTYTLTATNPFGSTQATATVVVGTAPLIASFSASPASVSPGQATTLSWSVSGATSLSLDQGIGPVTGTSRGVTPGATTTYTFTATNAFGSSQATATVTVPPPVIQSFTATPASLGTGQSATLTWDVVGATSLSLDQGIGAVTGTSRGVTPGATTTYTLTASNVSGTVTATATVNVGPLPVISSFTAGPHDYVSSTSPSCNLSWSVSGATGLTIDHGVGTVTTGPVAVSPTATTLYTLTATNAYGSVTRAVKVTYLALQSLDASTYATEHCLFLIPTPGQVTWPDWNSVYLPANLDAYVARLNAAYPDDWFLVVVAANNLTPNSVPNVITHRRPADGIGMGAIPVNAGPNICRYNMGGGTVIDGCFAVLDHEIGHCWGVFLGLEVGSGHWLANATSSGQLAASNFTPDYSTAMQIQGTTGSGFTWVGLDNLAKNETETFSDHDLYSQGLHPVFPDLYVLASPVFNGDHTVSHSGAIRYDHAWNLGKNGPRVPDYTTSEKQHRIATVYIARDLAEIQTVFMYVERSLAHFATAEAVDTTHFRFQVPYLVDTKFRASVDALLADLDGNATPTLSLGSGYLTSSDGTATTSFTAADPDGPAPTVSCVPADPHVTVDAVGGTLQFSGLTSGTHFFTFKAEDALGKKAFAHLVVDVN